MAGTLVASLNLTARWTSWQRRRQGLLGAPLRKVLFYWEKNWKDCISHIGLEQILNRGWGGSNDICQQRKEGIWTRWRLRYFHWHLNIQITHGHKDMYSFTVWALEEHKTIFIFLSEIWALLYRFRDKSRQEKDTKQRSLNNSAGLQIHPDAKKKERKEKRALDSHHSYLYVT